MNNFFSKAEEDIIIRAIQEAEKRCESEIRVHVDFADPKIQVLDAAVKAFNRMGMYKTIHRNGVLIFLLPERNEFAIIGDTAINEQVDKGFWEKVNQLMNSYFEDSRFVLGTCEAIQLIGNELNKYFPAISEKNELPDEISYS
ncbi:MAG: TPM domain-containing protein [Saprospiraceae bacterium]